MSLQVTGKVKQVFPEETRGNFTFRMIWIVTNDQYPQTIEIHFAQQKTALLDGINTDDEVTIDFNLRGREWSKDGKTSVFNTVQGWKITKTQSALSHTSTVHSGVNAPGAGYYNPTPDNVDDLPF